MLNSFHENGQSLGVDTQNERLEPPCIYVCCGLIFIYLFIIFFFWFKIFQTSLNLFSLVQYSLPLSKTKGNTNQTGLKNFKPQQKHTCTKCPPHNREGNC